MIKSPSLFGHTDGVLLLALTTSACVGPGALFDGTDEAKNTSCSSFGSHDPTPRMIPTAGPAIYGVGGSSEYVACFGGELKDPQGVAAIRWSSLNSRIATVSPPTGGRTTVRGAADSVDIMFLASPPADLSAREQLTARLILQRRPGKTWPDNERATSVQNLHGNSEVASWSCGTVAPAR